MTNNHSANSPLVIFMPSGRRGRIDQGTTVLEAARQLGVEIESICGGHLTCKKCRVRVENGHFSKHGITSQSDHLSAPSDEETAFLKRFQIEDCRLSCQAQLQGDALIFVPEESRGQKQIIHKAATKRIIAIAPAIRQVYVEVEPAILGDYRGDWERLQVALADNWQLSNLEIELPVLRRLQAALRQGQWAVTVTLWQEQVVIDVQPGYAEGSFGLAVDVGSTTLAAHLCDLRSGDLLATESMMNPQVAYGEDLMSRISYVEEHEDGLTKLHKAIVDALNKLAGRAALAAGLKARQIHDAVIVGNTTMTHLLLGISPVQLGGAPFALANQGGFDVKAREMGLRLHPGARVHILPSEAGHVGADNMGVLIAEEPYKQDEIVLLVDVGTNAEIVLGNREWMYSASSPTGPAFEGAQIEHGMRAAPGAIERVRVDPITKEPCFRVIGEERWSNDWSANEPPAYLAAGICGSGIIEAVVELYLAGVLLKNGRFNPDCQHDQIQWQGTNGAYILATAAQTATGETIRITQNDVRNIQLAKAALYAGIKLLMRRATISQVDRVVLAGAFGSYIKPKQAMILGLIPNCALAQVYAVGNAAGDGARIALLNRHKRVEAEELAKWVTYVETAIDPSFQKEFTNAIHLPHADDNFSHIAEFLPQQPLLSARSSSRRSRRQRMETT